MKYSLPLSEKVTFSIRKKSYAEVTKSHGKLLLVSYCAQFIH